MATTSNLTVASPIIGPAGLTSSQVIRRALEMGAPSEATKYIQAVYRYAPFARIRPDLLCAQSAEETDYWRSTYFREQGNPAGIGIWKSGVPSPWFTGDNAHKLTAEQSAIVHIFEMYIRLRALPSATIIVPKELGPTLLTINNYEERLVHLAQIMADAKRPKVQVLGDLCTRYTDSQKELQATWAMDPDYAKNIVAVWNVLAQGASSVATYVFGNIKHPPFEDSLVTDAQSCAWDDLGQVSVEGVCQHSMIGGLLGTNGWFKRGCGVSDGLTHYGIGGSKDGQLDGVIYRWNDPLGKPHDGVSANRSGWANGAANGLEGDGIAYVRSRGIAAVNRNLVSIERSDGGDIATPMSRKQFEMIAWLTAYWFDYAHVPWDTFPLNPALNLVTHFLHKEFATKDCPFPAVYNRINELQNRIRAILKIGQSGTIFRSAFQTSMDVPPDVPPVVVPKPTVPFVGADLRMLTEMFGQMPKLLLSGKYEKHGRDPKRYGFNIAGVVSNAWLHRADAENAFPRAVIWTEAINPDNGKVADYIEFANGWYLWRSAPNASWRWLGVDQRVS